MSDVIIGTMLPQLHQSALNSSPASSAESASTSISLHLTCCPVSHFKLGVRLCPAIQVRSEGETSHSGYLSDSSNSKSAVGLTRRCAAASPSRRLRFEDETETEAESRYLERQKRRAGSWGSGALTSKPILNMYNNSRAKRDPAGVGQCHSCRTGSGGRADLRLQTSSCDDRGRSPYRTHLNLRTEPIRETYIGFVTPCGTTEGGAGGGTRCLSNNDVKRRNNHAMPTADPPINPYAPNQVAMPTFRYSAPPPVTSLIMKEVQGGTAAAQPHRQHQAASELTERGPCVDLRRKSSDSLCLPAQVEPTMTSRRNSKSQVEMQALPTSVNSSDKQVKQPIRAKLHNDDTQLPEQLCTREESSRISLHRLFSNVRLSRTRTSSLDRLSLKTCRAAPETVPAETRKFSGLLNKCPSVQSLSEGVPFSQLKKSSVQIFGSDHKMEHDRLADFRLVADRFLRQTVESVENISCPSSSHSGGRVLDLELRRRMRGTFGFSISRRSSPHSGVYVDDMVDCSTEKLYSGLLSVGDEILEVNGEKVAGLSLDQVTELLTQNPSATVRINHSCRTPPH
ncbi:Partitioning defective 6 -like protein gamma [Channa argus]|uniref:Partitioning defective 6-like protein gamma n=1 Tax=Channa argus TaxID=215402 RepID=A0A6G1PKN2_CHAAH|nr:Partitioning defective 6 -like protein gamma [Channa argus]